MNLTGIDHIVLQVANVYATLGFYERVMGMHAREDSAGNWSLHFGSAKINLQTADTLPDMARGTTPGSANFCVVTEDDIAQVAAHLQSLDVDIVSGPGRKSGALGPMRSVYFHDPDGNLVEVCAYG